MAFLGEIADFIRTTREVKFEWKIDNFLNLSDKIGSHCRSSFFSFASRSWFFELYINGSPENNSCGWIDIVIRKDQEPDLTSESMYCRFAIKGSNGGVENEQYVKATFPQIHHSFTFSKVWRRDELIKHHSTLVPKNLLTIVINLRMDAQVIFECDGKGLADDFGNLFETKEGSDVTVKVDGAIIPVHSAFLFARCPALSMSLKDKSQEMVIVDCEAQIFKAFLRHLYTGSPGEITNVFKLYRLSKRYFVEDLAQNCLEHIQDSLSVETFCETVKLSIDYGDSDLLERAINFSNKNMEALTRSVKWQIFVIENPVESNEIFRKYIAFQESRS